MAKQKEDSKSLDQQGWDYIKKKVREMKAEIVIMNIAIVILGCLMITMPEQFETFIGQILGVILMVWGAIRCFAFISLKSEDMLGSFALVQGAAMLSFGVFFITQPDQFKEILKLMINLSILIIAVLKVQNAINYMRLQIRNWWIHLILGVLLAAFGIIAIINRGNMTTHLLFMLIGISFVVSGIWDIVSVIIMSKAIKKAAKEKEAQSRFVEAEAEDTAKEKKAAKKVEKAEKKAEKKAKNEEKTSFGDIDEIDKIDKIDKMDYGDKK